MNCLRPLVGAAYNKSMQDMDDDDRRQILGEVLYDELRIIREYLQDMPILKSDVAQLKADVEELKADMKIVKYTLKDTNSRLSKLEHAFTDHLIHLHRIKPHMIV